MASSDQSNDDTEMIRRLEHLERQIKEHDETQKNLRYISITGIAVMLAFFAFFFYRLYDYANTYEYRPLAERILKESAVIIRPETEVLLRELREDLMPAFFDKLNAEFRKSAPQFKSASYDLSDRLGTKIRQRAEERLLETMINSLESSSEELRTIFPDFTPEDLERQIGNSMGYYVERLHDVLEDRVAFVASSLDGLKGAVDQMQKSQNAGGEFPQTRSEAEDQLIDALLELVVYEIRPELGDQHTK